VQGGDALTEVYVSTEKQKRQRRKSRNSYALAVKPKKKKTKQNIFLNIGTVSLTDEIIHVAERPK
jgi:hypothetical protein